MIYLKSRGFSFSLVVLLSTCCNARFINLPQATQQQQDASDPMNNPRVLEALASAYGSNIHSVQQPSANQAGTHAHPVGNQKLLEAISDAYGVDLNPQQEHNYGPIGQTNEDRGLLEAIADAYGSDITAPRPSNQQASYLQQASPQETKILEAIAEAYGSEISATRSHPQVHGEDAKLLDAIIDTYGSDVSPEFPPVHPSQNAGIRNPPGTILPSPTENYRLPSGTPQHPQASMPGSHVPFQAPLPGSHASFQAPFQAPLPGSHAPYQVEADHTGQSIHDDVHLAQAPPPPGRIRPPPETELVYKTEDILFVPTVEERDKWQKEHEDKQKSFFTKYKTEGQSHDLSKFTSINSGYYSGSSHTNNKFSPNTEFFHIDHNVTRKDIGNLDYKLINSEEDYLNYETLSLTPHGRHLLLITLLEDITIPLWEPRFKGRLAYYLPKALRPPAQPENHPPGCIQLRDIVSHGRIVRRDEMLTRFRKKMPSVFKLEEDISRFNLTHGEAVGSLLEIILSQETFDSTLSLLAFIHNYVHPKVFSDTVITVIDVREDVGFIIPSFQTINPYDYFQILSFKNLTQYESKYGKKSGTSLRFKRQANRLAGRGQVWRISWNEGHFKTLPDTDPESKLWYFREDPMVSAHHLHWHLKMSNRAVPVWHPSNGLNMDRRGEMFYFMHKQMLCRFNADRIGLGMPLTTPFLPNEWGQPIFPGYNPKLTEPNGNIYPPRPHGARIPNIADMNMAYQMIRRAIREGTLRMPGGPQRLGYAQGVDYGISALGDAIEAFTPSPITGNLHNDGHQQIGLMHEATMGNEGTTGLGVMGNPNGAVRDPLFFRWHKMIDDVHQEYKNMLPEYSDQELNFPGVEITEAHVQSERGQGANNLYTYMDTTTVRLQSVDLSATDGSSVNIAYDRLNHIPFSYHVNIKSKTETQGLMRIFLIPAGVRLPPHTDVTQVSIEMDRFLIMINPGDNYFTRHSTSSPFVSKSSMPLVELQERLLMGEISEEQFNWSGCGWPETMVLPRGSEGGMGFRLYIMVSQVLPGDSALTANWERMQFTSWSWCGVRRNEGDVPDSRPMGFPLDRAPKNGNWQSLMYKNGVKRGNHISVDVTIRHDPVGTTGRRRTNQRG